MNAQNNAENHENRVRRLRMRSWRRGIKEMDMILGPFSDKGFKDMSEADIDLYDQLLWENDQDLYQWFSNQIARPAEYSDLIAHIMQQHRQD